MKKILLLLILSTMAYTYSVKTYIPVKAYKYLPIMYKAVDEICDDFILPPYFGSLIEQESCIHLKHSRCWSPTSQLKTKRELGIGFGQITKAYTKTGRVRFDTLRSLKRRYPKYLKELTWKNIKRRPDLQMKAIMLLWRGNYRRIPNTVDEWNKISFADSAYNGGYGAIIKSRKRCGLRKGCNPNIWEGNVADVLVKSKRPIYGKNSAYSINRDHVRRVMKLRLNKYIDDYYHTDKYK